MRSEYQNNPSTISLEARRALASGYECWNSDYQWDIHLNLRPKSPYIRRPTFTGHIGCAFADAERAILGDQVFKRNKSNPRYRIHRAVFVESEAIDIHAHILIHLPKPQTHVTPYMEVDLNSYLREAWYNRLNLIPEKNKRNFLWEPIVSDGINGYPVKECKWFGNTDNWDDRSSFIPM